MRLHGAESELTSDNEDKGDLRNAFKDGKPTDSAESSELRARSAGVMEKVDLKSASPMEDRAVRTISAMYDYAEGGTRTRTPRGATPSRWCVCQFHHFGFSNSSRYFFSGVGAAGVLCCCCCWAGCCCCCCCCWFC